MVPRLSNHLYFWRRNVAKKFFKLVLTCARYLEKKDIKSVDKLRQYIMFNGVSSKRRIALPVKSICRKE